MLGYVDDGRQSGTTLSKGMEFDKVDKIFNFSLVARADDVKWNESSNVRMQRCDECNQYRLAIHN